MGKRTEYMKAWREANKERIKAYEATYQKAYYQANKEKVKAKVTDWYQDHKEEKKAYNKVYYQDPDNKTIQRIHKKAYELKMYDDPLFIIRRRAYLATRNALRRGHITKLPCEVCGSVETEAHHDDYYKPLEIRWLCKEHHAEHHKNNNII